MLAETVAPKKLQDSGSGTQAKKNRSIPAYDPLPYMQPTKLTKNGKLQGGTKKLQLLGSSANVLSPSPVAHSNNTSNV